MRILSRNRTCQLPPLAQNLPTSTIPLCLARKISFTSKILKGNGGTRPVLEYLPEDYVVEEGTDVFTSGKDGIFLPGSPIGKTTQDGKVKLFSESSQLSFVKIDISQEFGENF